jgi:cell division protein FtsB
MATMTDMSERQDLSRAARAAMATPQGRKRRGASISIPLKPREKPVDMPPDVKKSLRNELDVRYLESIGAAPSKTNLAMVRKHIPPEKCTFSTAWKSRGWISDTLFITLQDPKDAAPVVAARRHREAAADIGAIDRLPAALHAGGGAAAAEDEDEAVEQTELQLQAPSGSMSFDDGRRTFLYPYRHLSAPKVGHRARTNLTKRSIDRGAASAPPSGFRAISGSAFVGEGNGGEAADEWSVDGDAEDDEHDRHGSAAAAEEDGQAAASRGMLPPISPQASPTRRGKYNFTSRDPMKYAPFTEREILHELAQPLELHTRDIMQHQLDFLQSFPFDLVRAAASATPHGAPASGSEDMTKRHAQEEIAAPRTARFIGMLALFLYRFHMRERCRQPADEAKLSALVCAVQQYFTALRRRMMSQRRLIMIVLPALLLSVRMTIEALFRNAFKKWWTTIDGRATLQEMDAMIEQLFDPNHYHSHIAPLESSTEAIKIAARQELGVKKAGDREARYFQTSVAVSTALPRAPIVQHRRNLAGDTELDDHLARLATTDVRKSLFRAARTRPSPDQATAAAAKLVEGMIARPAKSPGAAAVGSYRKPPA